MELRHLRYFLAVAEHLSYARAAEALRTSQPSLSQQIKQLERELGVLLFERTKRYVALTPAGLVLLPEAQGIIEATALLRARVGDEQGTLAGRLRLGAYPSATLGVLPRVLPSFRAAFPGIELAVDTIDLGDQIRALLERRIDVGILREPIADPRLAAAPIGMDYYTVSLSSTHPLAQRHAVPIATLDGETFIQLRAGAAGSFYDGVAQLLRIHGVRPAKTIETSDIGAIFALVASGVGVAIGTTIASTMRFDGVAFRMLEPSTKLGTMRIACRRDRRNVPIIAAFIDHVQTLQLEFVLL